MLSALLLPVGLAVQNPSMLRTAVAPRSSLSVQMQYGDVEATQGRVDQLRGNVDQLRRENAKLAGGVQNLNGQQGYVAPTNPPNNYPGYAQGYNAPMNYQNGYQPAAPTPTMDPRAARVLGPIALVAGAAAGTLAISSLTAPKAITKQEVYEAQKQWGDAIVRISKTYLNGGDYAAVAAQAADELYGYGRTDVLFKPTKAAEVPFRPTGAGAMSYFIGGDKVEGGYSEDKGFALGPGGVGWKKVIFDNSQIDLNGNTAQAMGEYYFYSAKDDSVSKVEYTFGYKRNDDGQIRIYLHHSSLPYQKH